MKDPDKYLPDPGYESNVCQTCLWQDVEYLEDEDCIECESCRVKREDSSSDEVES